jgi:hypothetical protein
MFLLDRVYCYVSACVHLHVLELVLHGLPIPIPIPPRSALSVKILLDLYLNLAQI